MTDDKGRQRKRYLYEHMMTPYEKLRSLPAAQQRLKAGITWKTLDALASAMSDHKSAKPLNESRDLLFRSLTRRPKAA